MSTLDENLYRCRVRNAFGQVFSNPATLTVVAGYTWTPPLLSFDGDPLAAQDAYSAVYVHAPTQFDSISSSLIGPAFTMASQLDDNLQPPTNGFIDGSNLFSVYFSTPGSKAFSFDLSLVSGSFPMLMPSGAGMALLLMDNTTVVDSANAAGTGPISTTFNLNVPAPGQYLVFGGYLRVCSAPGSTVKLQTGYNLGAGDQIALVVP